LVGQLSAPNNRPIVIRLPINAKKTYFAVLLKLCYSFRLRLLTEDSYLLEGLQTAGKTKTHPKAKLQNAPTFTGNGSHSHVCLLLVTKIKTCDFQLCKRQSTDTNILIGRYWLSAKRLIIGPIPIIGASLIFTPVLGNCRLL